MPRIDVVMFYMNEIKEKVIPVSSYQAAFEMRD
jgi:hypothetical protein